MNYSNLSSLQNIIILLQYNAVAVNAIIRRVLTVYLNFLTITAVQANFVIAEILCLLTAQANLKHSSHLAYFCSRMSPINSRQPVDVESSSSVWAC